jgi:3-dehydroquinate synthase II
MKQVWVQVIPWNLDLARAAMESGADALWVEPGVPAEVKKIGLIPTIAEDGDLRLGREVIEAEIRNKKDEAEIAAIGPGKKVLVRKADWTIIPLENLLARSANLFLEITDEKEGQTAFGILEKGVDGVLVQHSDPQRVRQIVKALKEESESLDLSVARIKRIEPLGLGDRVCVDTCSNLSLGEGMLIGNSSQALFLVHSESVENPFVNPRPFRVNAGPVHAYIRLPRGQTKYLSEIGAGDAVLAVSHEGKCRPVVVGRAKIERRPLALVEAEEGGQRISIILQNAETLRLTQPDGKPLSLVDLREGSEVLIFREGAGRHFGVKVDETILER